MSDIKEHARRFSFLLQSKGYIDNFTSTEGYPARMPEQTLISAFEAVQNGKMPVTKFPPTLLTYLFWANERSDSVRCRFDLEYSQQEGFQVTKMHIERHEPFRGLTDEREIGIYSESRIPPPLQALRTVMSGRELILISISEEGKTLDPICREYLCESADRDQEVSLDTSNWNQKDRKKAAIADGKNPGKIVQARKRKRGFGL